jgi:hypothetical protein
MGLVIVACIGFSGACYQENPVTAKRHPMTRTMIPAMQIEHRETARRAFHASQTRAYTPHAIMARPRIPSKNIVKDSHKQALE